MKETASPIDERREQVFAFLGGLGVCLLLQFIRFGYDFGNSDQDELIPAVLRLLSSNSLFGSDWFVRYQTESFNVRTPIISLIATLSKVVPIFDAVVGLYVLSIAASYAAVYRLAVRMSASNLVPWLASVGVLVVTKGFTLGGNDIVNSMYVPSMSAWALALWALYFWMSARPILAGLLAGAAVPLQALVGLQTALLLTAATGLQLLSRRFASDFDQADSNHLKSAFSFLAAFTVVALWPVLAIVANQNGNAVAASSSDPFYTVLATIRAPHHFLPSHFSARSVASFFALAAAGLGALFFDHVRKEAESRDTHSYAVLLTAIFLICTISLTFTEVIPVGPIVKLQLFKMTVFAKVLLSIAAVAATVRLAETPVHLVRERAKPPVLIRHGSTAFLCILIAVLVPIAWNLRHETAWAKRQRSDWATVETWIRANTSEDAVFIVPPSISHFRTGARRAIFVNYKATPFRRTELLEWKRRLQIATGLDPIPPGVSAADLDSAFESRSPAYLDSVARQHDINYVATERQFDAVGPIYSSGSVFVYRTDSLITN